MKIYHFQTQLWLPQQREIIFGFFAEPRNLERLTPPWLRFEILGENSTIQKWGTLIDYRLRIRGIPVRWQSEISVWDPPRRFVDKQIRGPYRLWVHEHKFIEDAGGTRVEDHVRYSVPGGSIVQKWLVAPDLQRIFRYRHDALRQIFNPGGRTPNRTANPD
jgi:ligand-binding SRPBCC domain-containing protein